jgi:peptidylprolyl isomerase
MILMGAILVVGCTGDDDVARVKNGDIVKVHYTGTLEDGTVFDTSREREPLEFTLGEGSLIEGFEQAVIGMQVGQSKTVTIPAEKAYGPHRDELVFVLGRNQLPGDLDPKVGQQLQAKQPEGQTITGTIIDVSEMSITVNANHPLAGKDLTFEIELMDIE